MKLHAYKPRFLELFKQRPSGSDFGREAGAGLTVGIENFCGHYDEALARSQQILESADPGNK